MLITWVVLLSPIFVNKELVEDSRYARASSKFREHKVAYQRARLTDQAIVFHQAKLKTGRRAKTNKKRQ